MSDARKITLGPMGRALMFPRHVVPPISPIEVRVSIRMSFEEMERTLTPDQITAVMIGVGQCVAANAQPEGAPR